jgi:tetratricopeptide (TPR) repeat protein
VATGQVSADAPRVVRVFVSSTFRDMQAERDYLVKFIFPQLRKLCEQRGVVWGAVDLRWGITTEQAAEGKVLPICLAEIRRCRPYFVGLLGERYGWVPGSMPPQLVEQEPWLAQHKDHSVTELEILHGVLNDPAMAGHAFFYFRDPAYVRDKPDMAEASETGRHKLNALKDRIRSSRFPVHENYVDPKALGQLVLADLTAVIDNLYPEGSQLEPLDRDAAEHEAYARGRTRVFVGRQEYYDRLDAHTRGDGPPLVILGESGCGKTALLANWGLHHRKEHLDHLVLMHFIGETPSSADWTAMLRRIMGEFRRRLGLQTAIPEDPDELRAMFPTWLSMAAERRRIVLILDGLNQLEDRDQAPDLAWLPPEIPANIRMILSTLPGSALDDLHRRQWPTMTVEPLRTDERQTLLRSYLAQSARSLSSEHVALITSAPQAANPLFLRALLDELSVWGDHDTLGQRIAHYLAVHTVDDLFEKILERYEQDYETERPGLVRDAMSALWAARRGLTEAELLDILGTGGQALPRPHWSPLYLAADTVLDNRSGLLVFDHDYLRKAVQDRYLPTEQQQRAAHARLAAHFRSQTISSRRIDEQPWQLAQAKDWQRLSSFLADLPFFAAAWDADSFEVKRYWAQVETHSNFRMIDAYRPIRAKPMLVDPALRYRIATLLGHAGHSREALELLRSLAEHYRRTRDVANLAAALGDQAALLYRLGDLDGALALHKQEERLFRELGDRDGLLVSLGNQANIRHARGDLDGAMALHKEEEYLCRELGDNDGLQATLGNQALILQDRGEIEGALDLLKEKERLCRQLGNMDSLANALGNQALIYHDRGDADSALALHEEQERLSRELGNKQELAYALAGRANILYSRGDLDGAMALYKEVESLCRALGNKGGLQEALSGQALILRDRGDLKPAILLCKEQQRLCQELGDKRWLSICLGNQGVILRDLGDLEGAMAAHKSQHRLCIETGYKQGLSSSLGGQASILRERGDLQGAMALHKEQERICREQDDREGLSDVLGGQASVLRDQGNISEAMALYEEQARLCREMNAPRGLAQSLAGQSAALAGEGRQDEARALAQEAQAIADRHGLTVLAQEIKQVLERQRPGG